MFPSLCSPRNIMGNNVSTTMCSCLLYQGLKKPLGTVFERMDTLSTGKIPVQCIIMCAENKSRKVMYSLDSELFGG